MTDQTAISSGLSALDAIVQGLRLGDNVVWQVDQLDDYGRFVQPFIGRALQERRRCLYLRFAPHPPVLDRDGVRRIDVDPHDGFDTFSTAVHRIIEAEGREAFYVFDNLSSLVDQWATDELLANFFQVTCPFLFELDTVAYFALTRGQHAHSAVARIRDTTQVLLDVYRVQGNLYLHPLKVWGRYSPQMFLPHAVKKEGAWTPVFRSGDAAALSTRASRQPLHVMTKSIAPWESVYDRLLRHREQQGDIMEDTPEVVALKSELSRMLIGHHPEFDRLVDAYLTVGDLLAIRERLIGSGRIGGKAAGMLMARRILLSGKERTDFSAVLERHDSFYIGSDVFFTFLVQNDLFRLRLHFSRLSQISLEEFDDVELRFLEGKFPAEILEQFRDMLDYFGQAPIIVRSSSLLEDSMGNAFAGKYRSEYCANQGNPEDRLEAFLQAVKLVYASTLNPDALIYRRQRGLGESDEQMAILVQRVSGMPYKNYFFPALAGVAFSRNLYAWTDRIDPRQGMVRLVFGLGTRAVNRVGNDYPRMIALSHPQIRPEAGMRIAKYSQWEVDLLDLRENAFVTRSLMDVLADRDYPQLYFLVSLMTDGYMTDPYTARLENSSQKLVLTFNNLINRTAFVKVLKEMLARLEAAYGRPLDTEFTASVNEEGQVRINLLQCRPMRLPGLAGPVPFPDHIPPEKVLFKTGRTISGGVVPRIRYILYIDPKHYAAISSLEVKQSVGRVVGAVNRHPRLAGDRMLMMGPGRWGSSNIHLGVNVSYADISNTSVLVEIAREEAGQVPEVSYGTHFFLDLVEAQIIYLPVYPNDPEADFRDDFFAALPNRLTTFLPEAASFESIVRLFDIPRETGGFYARVVADPSSQRAVCYLTDEEAS